MKSASIQDHNVEALAILLPKLLQKDLKALTIEAGISKKNPSPVVGSIALTKDPDGTPEQLQPCRLPVPSHPSYPCAAVRAGGLPAASSAGQPLARGVRTDPRRRQQRAGWQQGGMGWADAVGGKGHLIFPSP